MANDDYSTQRVELDSPAKGFDVVAPNDSADLTNIARGVYVGVSGNLNVVMLDDSAGVITSVASGVIHPIRIKRILATDTTATNILAFY